MRRVAVTGFGVVSPVGVGASAFWDGLTAGRSGIGPITRFDCSTMAARLAGQVPDGFVAPPETAQIAVEDPKVGFGFAAVQEALKQAGVTYLGSEALVHLGLSLEVLDPAKTIVDGKPDFAAAVRRGLSGGGPLQVPLDTCTALVAKLYGRPGQALTNCSACAAGAQAIGHGFREVRAGRCELAVCGGLDSMVNPLGIGGFQLLGALTTENDLGPSACRPFDAGRSGTVLGEGAGAVVLEPLDRARAAGKTVLAEVCGYGSTLDACSVSAPDPHGDGAARAMEAALRDANLRPDGIAHINAHGTATILNDEVEAMAIRRVFATCWGRIPVSATKSVTGHLIAAAGPVEVGACLLATMRGVLPPNPWLATTGRGCELDHVVGRARAFEGEYLLTNSFGFGGQNATLILRRYHD